MHTFMLWQAFGQHAHVGMHAPAGLWACMLRQAFVQHAHVGMHDLVGMQLPHDEDRGSWPLGAAPSWRYSRAIELCPWI